MLSGACFSMFFHAKGIDLGLQQACSCGSIACARAGWAMSPVARKHCFSPSRPSPAHPRVAVFFLAAYRFFPVLAVFMACLRDEKCEKKRTLLRFATMRCPTCPALFHAAGRRGRGCAALRRIRLERSSSAWRVAPSPPLAFSGVPRMPRFTTCPCGALARGAACLHVPPGRWGSRSALPALPWAALCRDDSARVCSRRQCLSRFAGWCQCRGSR